MPRIPTPGQSLPVAASGCENCREHHLKCDRVAPTCGRCRATNRKCRRSGVKIRLVKKPFEQKQRWIKTPKRLVFIDETKSIAREAQDREDRDSDDDFTFSSPTPPSEESVPHDTRNGAAELVRTSGSETIPGSPTDRFIPHEEVADSAKNHHHHPPQHRHSREGTALGDLRSHIYLDRSVWPLTNLSEAALFRHYVQNLAIWLDPCDPLRSFQAIVPQRAGTCPVLLNAIFALAARHLSHISDYDPLESNRYHEACFKYLIPMLDHAATVSDENLFAATIILRVLEEMEVKNMGMDNHGYLLGIHAFVKAGDHHLLSHTLGAAAFWVGLRQEIYSAVMNHQPVRVNLIDSLVDRSFDSADDYTWANRAVAHCADVLNFCFEAGGSRSAEESRWAELQSWNAKWAEAAPDSFTPLYQKEGTDDTFPEFWYHNSCHVMGIQHHILAELFLVRFDPNVPRVGARRKAAETETTLRIQALVRRICGIGLGNQWTPPGMFTACMAIAAFGDHFQSRQDQDAMLDILKKTEKYHLRPTEAVQHQILNAFKK